MAQTSSKKLEHSGSAEKERVALVPQSERLARTPEPTLTKRKRTELPVQITRWDRVKGSDNRTRESWIPWTLLQPDPVVVFVACGFYSSCKQSEVLFKLLRFSKHKDQSDDSIERGIVSQPLPSDGSMVEDQEAPETGQFLKALPRNCQ